MKEALLIKESKMRAIVWFNKDLRIKDNPALYYACKNSIDGVIGVYILNYDLWQKCHTSPTQIEFIYAGIQKLASDLATIGVSLIIKEARKTTEIPKILLDMVQQYQSTNLFFNNEYEYYESTRNTAVEKLLISHGIKINKFDSQLILPRESIIQEKPNGYKIFTAFKRSWLKLFLNQNINILPITTVKHPIKISASTIPSLSIQSKIKLDQWPAGEAAARARLKSFIKNNLSHYHTERDFPYLKSTSKLSPYLATGMISPKECFLAALNFNNGEIDTGNRGATTWMSELIWREFYRHILIINPHISRGKPYKTETDKLAWQYDENLLRAWQQGKTGFPIVDAAMRQLNATGWMHNRLRMITAMFLSKNLFLDWRLGEQYFAENLIDCDFASNNGGWQWCASTGTDAVPYFRLFNPTTQSKRFDPEGNFIRKFCPELKNCETKSIHEPSKSKQNLDYPKPIIDYAKSRQQILAAFKQLYFKQS